MNTKIKSDRKKTQRKITGLRQEKNKRDRSPQTVHVYLGAHDQEHPETRLTR